MQKRRLYFINAVTENKEFAKAVNGFFSEKKTFNDELVKSFFVDEAYKYAELSIREKEKRIIVLEENIKLSSQIIQLNNKIIQLQGRLFDED